jgi:hypothetical protein
MDMHAALFDLDAAIARATTNRDVGIEHAAVGQENRSPGWIEECVALLAEWSRGRGQFLAEDFVASGLCTPPAEPRAWGAVFQCAARRGILRRAGYARARSSNLSPKVLWERAP